MKVWLLDGTSCDTFVYTEDQGPALTAFMLKEAGLDEHPGDGEFDLWHSSSIYINGDYMSIDDGPRIDLVTVKDRY